MSDLVQIADLTPHPRLPGATRAYHAMVKPVGAICNIDCTYCYYLHKEELLGSKSKFQITDEILETHIRQYIEGQDRDEVVFSWQGGEPTLLGLEFFQQSRRAGAEVQEARPAHRERPADQRHAAQRRVGRVPQAARLPRRPQHRRAERTARPLPRDQGRQADLPQSVRRVADAAPSRRAVQHVERHQPRQREKAARRVPLPEERSPPAADAVHPVRRAQGLSQRRAADVGPANRCRCSTPPPRIPAIPIPSSPTGPSIPTTGATSSQRSGTTGIAATSARSSSTCSRRPWRSGWARNRSSASITSSAARASPWSTTAACIPATTTSIPNTSWAISWRRRARAWCSATSRRNLAYAKFNTLPTRCRECKYLFACNGECPKNRLIRTPEGQMGLNYLCSGLQKFWHHIDQDAQDICRRIARGEPLKPQ